MNHATDLDMLNKILDVEFDSNLKSRLLEAFQAKSESAVDASVTARFPKASSTKGKLIMEAYEENPKVAVYMLITFCDIEFAPDCREAVEGVLNARLYAKGFTKNVAPERDELRRLRNEAANFIQELKIIKQSSLDIQHAAETSLQTLETHCQQAARQADREASERIKVTVNDHSALMDQFIKDKTAYCEAHAEQMRNELEQLKEHYKSSIALQAPVAFWAENQREHQKSAKDFVRWILIVGPLSIGTLFWIGWSFLANTEVHHWGKTTLFIFLSASVMWLLRIIIRLYLCHKHLEVDARERIVLAKTYLSLLADGVGPPDDQRKIVFQALFRPSTTGIIKEDDHPNPMIELVTKAAGK